MSTDLSPVTTKGSCLCGAIQFEISGAPKMFHYCHCESCRKTTSTAHASNLIYPPEQFRWLAGDALIQRYIDQQNNPGYKRFFCSVCGSAVPRLTRTEQYMVVQAGLLDGDPPARPERSIFWNEKAPWYTDLNDLPKFTEGLDSALADNHHIE